MSEYKNYLTSPAIQDALHKNFDTKLLGKLSSITKNPMTKGTTEEYKEKYEEEEMKKMRERCSILLNEAINKDIHQLWYDILKIRNNIDFDKINPEEFPIEDWFRYYNITYENAFKDKGEGYNSVIEFVLKGYNSKKYIEIDSISNVSITEEELRKNINICIYMALNKCNPPSENFHVRDQYLGGKKNKTMGKRNSWKCLKPSYHQRTVMLKKCGKKCFLGSKKSFPICSKNTCKINKKGIRAAYVRAKEYLSITGKRKYRNISRKAKRMLKK